MSNNWQSRAIRVLLITAILSILVTVSVIDLTPPVSRDALAHHLAIPKLWLKNGGFFETPWATYSYYPMNVDLLYLACLSLHNDIAPKFVHFAFALATALLLYLYLDRRLGRTWALLGFLFFLSTPVIIRLSCSAYVDLGLVFFTTASVLAFLKWKESHFERLKWFVVSALCMGLAAGTKYNALIAWLFLNLAIGFCYSRQCKNPIATLKYCVLFFAICLAVASPWYVKNYFLTSNPFFPLFGSLFNDSSHSGGMAQLLHSGLFYDRRVQYGEGFWKTLLIPLRMFFQGRDNSAQFFDGQLNPILIVTLPFAFLKKDFQDDKFFFLFFALFFILVALFRSVPRIRYITPVVPFLAVLSVMGLKTLFDACESAPNVTRRLVRTTLFSCTALLIFPNATYLAITFKRVQPVPYILNRQSREAFLESHLRSFPAIHYINKHLAVDAKIFLVFLGRRGYYIDRPYRHESTYGMTTVGRMVRASHDEKAFSAFLASLGCTHMLIRTDLFDKYLQDNFKNNELAPFQNLFKRHCRPVFKSDGYAVFVIRSNSLQQ